MSYPRPDVLLVGSTAADSLAAEISGCGLAPKSVGVELTEVELATARGLILCLPDWSTAAAVDAIAPALSRALTHGLMIRILCRLADVPVVARIRKRWPFRSQVAIVIPAHIRSIAEDLLHWDPGPMWSAEVTVTGDEGLRAEDQVLLRRAFGNCAAVALVRQPGGRSADVFCAFARLADSRAGPLPLPFFVKLDKYPKIARELDNYQHCTTLFIPFNQRPNLDQQRCSLGAERGIIVGNFIEESETLVQLVDRGTARAALNSLFGGALRGWRNQAYYDASNTVTQSFASDLPACLPRNMPPWRRSVLRRHSAASSDLTTPQQLEELFLSLPPITYRRAMTHGDLHGENVRVHRGEAILIDFTSTDKGPLVRDSACLDVALGMSTATVTEADWLAFAESAYSIGALIEQPPPPDPTEPAAAVWESIRLIRQIALADQVTPAEYSLAVALELMRRASYRPQPIESRERRIVAYRLAARLALAITVEFQKRAPVS